MSELNFVAISFIVITIHLVSAGTVLFLMSKKIQNLLECKRNKYVLAQIKKLENHRLLVAVLPLIGPIIGLAVLSGVNLGVPEKGLKVNSPGNLNSFSDSE